MALSNYFFFALFCAKIAYVNVDSQILPKSHQRRQMATQNAPDLRLSRLPETKDYLRVRKDANMEWIKGMRSARQKTQLVRKAGSTSNETAKAAVHEMRKKNWLKGESSLLRIADLEGASLSTANLQGANLSGAKLQGANLSGAKLQGADLSIANLQGVDLEGADLKSAKLGNANLQGADLFKVNLEGADLRGANLQGTSLLKVNLEGADLRDANLKGAGCTNTKLGSANLSFANLEGTKLSLTKLEGANLSHANLEGAHLNALFDDNTTLPGGTKWTHYIDMKRFTNPKHPKFWRSDNKRSPAYRGNVVRYPKLPPT